MLAALPRFLTQYKLAGTRSFRLSASQLFGYGGNAQNTDKDSLDIFEAPEGYSIVSADQAGAEALIVAYLAKPGRYRELFTEGVKPHIYVALHLFLDKFRGDHPRDRYWLRRPSELKQLPEWPELSKRVSGSKFEYDIGKRTGHASNYKMGPNTFRDSCLKESEGTLNLTFQEATFFLGTYKALFPEIVEWQDEIEQTIQATRLLRNLFGFPRRFERLFSDSYTREAISWIPQSTVGCITHRAFGIVGAACRRERPTAALFNNKHDSLAIFVRDSDVPWAARTLSGALDVELTGRDGAKFRMKNEVQVGRNMKKWSDKNPMGLKDYKL